MHACLERHRGGDFGVTDYDPHDRAVNAAAAAAGGRVLSAYPIDPTQPCRGHGPNTLWIITEGTGPHRRTSILLPDEY